MIAFMRPTMPPSRSPFAKKYGAELREMSPSVRHNHPHHVSLPAHEFTSHCFTS